MREDSEYSCNKVRDHVPIPREHHIHSRMAT